MDRASCCLLLGGAGCQPGRGVARSSAGTSAAAQRLRGQPRGMPRERVPGSGGDGDGGDVAALAFLGLGGPSSRRRWGCPGGPAERSAPRSARGGRRQGQRRHLAALRGAARRCAVALPAPGSAGGRRAPPLRAGGVGGLGRGPAAPLPAPAPPGDGGGGGGDPSASPSGAAPGLRYSGSVGLMVAGCPLRPALREHRF